MGSTSLTLLSLPAVSSETPVPVVYLTEWPRNSQSKIHYCYFCYILYIAWNLNSSVGIVHCACYPDWKGNWTECPVPWIRMESNIYRYIYKIRSIFFDCVCKRSPHSWKLKKSKGTFLILLWQINRLPSYTSIGKH